VTRGELARLVRDELKAKTGREISLKDAGAVVRGILKDRDDIADPASYVKAAIKRDPRGFLPSAGPVTTKPLPRAHPDDVAAYLSELQEPQATEPHAANGEEPTGEAESAVDRPRKSGQAAELVALARFRYRMVTSEDGHCYAAPVTGPAIVIPIRGPGGLRTRLAWLYAQEHPGAVASSTALTDAMTTLEGLAAGNDPEPVHLRIAQLGDGIVIDLGTADGRCVIAGPAGWRTADEPPVLFRRSKLTSPMPAPVRAADGLALLRSLLNVEDAEYRLIVGWLVSGLIPGMPHPVLALRGEQGTAKSTAARLLTTVIDPSPAPLRSAPHNQKQWATCAAASWVVTLDNLSSIPGWLSDALCRAVTGEAFIDRALYSDDDVTVLSFLRVIALTSIGTGSLAGDLAERMLVVDLQPIPDHRRRREAQVREAFEAGRPAIFGALLDQVAAVLARRPRIQLPQLPRMADFAQVLAALDQANGWTTLADYASGAIDTAAEVIEGDAFAVAVRDFTRQHRKWAGTATELHELLPKPNPVPKGWPPDPTRVGHALTRCAPALRQQGIQVDKQRAGSKRERRLIFLSLSPSQAEEGDPASAASDDPQ
jgi:hypothetical protein